MKNVYAFYGSLRSGLLNYEAYATFLRYRFSTWIVGYEMYSLGDFPFAIRTNIPHQKILVEVFEIESEEIQRQIDQLELGYGYHKDIIEIDGQLVTIYLFKEKANYPKVNEGDWVKFFRG
ncbi:MAG: gamma-glutamylcyclotransferase [Cyclobacteriaceae bacterium]|nr:gamma-glutamylcyclotransferase [Cyclobacteriaceae bacterium]